MSDESYDAWVKSRREVDAPETLTDSIMSAVTSRDELHTHALAVRLALWVDRSRAARWAACVGALIVGSTPFVFLAYVARILGV